METRIYRASGLGGCIKAQAAYHLGYTALQVPEKMGGIFHEGNLHEEDVVARLKEMEYEVIDQQLEVNLPVTSSVIVQGHIDGKVYLPKSMAQPVSGRLLEIKSMGLEPYNEWIKLGWNTPGLIQKYKWQVSAYMLATEMELMFVVKNRNNGKLEISYLEKPFYTKAEIAARVLEIERYVRSGTLPDACDVSVWPCLYRYLGCTKEEVEYSETEIRDLAVAVLDAKREKDIAEAREKVARKGLKDAVKGKMVIGDITITPITTTTIRVERAEQTDEK